MKTILRLPSFFSVLLFTCLVTGCAGAMSDQTISVSMETLTDHGQEQGPADHIEIIDLRRDTTMRRTAFSVSLGKIILSPPERLLIKQLVANALRRVAGDGGRRGELPTIYCGIKTFDIVTPATPLYWDVTARIELILRFRGNERAVSGEAVERTWIYPSAEIIHRVTTQALHDTSVPLEEELRTLLAPAL